MELKLLVSELAIFLQVDQFQDYCPNGLQVEGRPQVQRVMSGVTASQALIDAAIAWEADAILVHHGYFWRGESAEITGMKKQRLKSLLDHDISLLAYHLPLDSHPVIGNNAQLGKQFGWNVCRHLDNRNMLAVTELPQSATLQTVAEHIAQCLQRQPLVLGELHRTVRSVAWCTGAAQHYIQQAIDAGIDLFISGEVSEQTYHAVAESNTAYIAAGHHATEQYGVQALGQWMTEQYGLLHEYYELNNPI